MVGCQPNPKKSRKFCVAQVTGVFCQNAIESATLDQAPCTGRWCWDEWFVMGWLKSR